MKLMLASQSPRRRRLLAELGLTFDVVSPEVEELQNGFLPVDLVRENALRKWRWCAAHAARDAMILAADTTVELDGASLGKPRDRDEAFAMLRRESGRMQAVHTGLVLGTPARGESAARCTVETSYVTFRNLTDAGIWQYIERVQPFDRAGAYDIDESGDLLIASYRGSRTNVMGLPCERLQEWLSCWSEE